MIKFYGWEISFVNIIHRIREAETHSLLLLWLFTLMRSVTSALGPFLFAAVSFTMFILIDENNVLDPKRAIVSLTIFNMLRFPLMHLPYIINALMEMNLSITRIRRFLLKDEINVADVTHDKDDGKKKLAQERRICIFNCSFAFVQSSSKMWPSRSRTSRWDGTRKPL